VCCTAVTLGDTGSFRRHETKKVFLKKVDKAYVQCVCVWGGEVKCIPLSSPSKNAEELDNSLEINTSRMVHLMVPRGGFGFVMLAFQMSQ
jgi:hypothetical protein